MRPSVIVSVHDVAPCTREAMFRWLDLLDRRRVVASLLVVPGPWRGQSLGEDTELVTTLHAATERGHEISLHGFTHTVERGQATSYRSRALGARLLARGCAEFGAIEVGEAHRRVNAGIGEMRRLGFDVTGFTPPGWLLSPGALEALRHTDLTYATTQWHVRELSTWRRLRIPALSHRPDSPWSGAAAETLLRVGRRRLTMGRATRIALHPRDLDDHRLLDATMSLIDHALDLGACFTTYAQLVRRRVTPTRTRTAA